MKAEPQTQLRVYCPKGAEWSYRVSAEDVEIRRLCWDDVHVIDTPSEKLGGFRQGLSRGHCPKRGHLEGDTV